MTMSERPSRHSCSEEMADTPTEELRIEDRRRLTPDGELRDDAERNADAPSEQDPSPEKSAENRQTPDDASAAAEEALAAAEQRALEAEEKLRRYATAYDQIKEESEALRRRLERDFEQRVRETLSRTFLEMLGALDNLERTFAHAEQGPLLEGVKLVHKQMLDLLEAEGVERLEVVGKPFDPEESEAVMVTPAQDDQQKGQVVEELRPGYRFEGKILRPAQVRVAS